MSMLTDSVASVLSIKIKQRDDGVTDQYNRILMTKMCIIFSAIIGCNYFSDEVTCIVDNSETLGDTSFVGDACWIQGFYIYEEMKERLSDSAYFGLPRNMDYDGVDSAGVLCSTTDRGSDAIKSCDAMHKKFYLQYQYMPFLIASLSMLFYFPYMVFKVTNTDLVSLKSYLKTDNTTADVILTSYFDYRKNSKRGMRYRVLMNIFVKVLYLLANLVAFLGIDCLLNGDYIRYGANMMRWSTLKNFEAYDHSLKVRVTAKPGNVLLPPMGYCEIQEAARDLRNTRINYHKNLLLLLWFLLICGIILSVVGIVIALCGHILTILCFMNTRNQARDMYGKLTTREIDYLEYIRRKNMPLYTEVLKILKESRGVSHELKEM